jgi:hypothetical protein
MPGGVSVAVEAPVLGVPQEVPPEDEEGEGECKQLLPIKFLYSNNRASYFISLVCHVLKGKFQGYYVFSHVK